MNYNMYLPRSHHNTSESEDSKPKSKGEAACSSSDYSTCSDDLQSNMYTMKKILQASRDSVILAGHIVLNETDSNSVLEDTNFSISSLDKDSSKPNLNLAILCSESSDDVYSDCRDLNYSNSSNDSTLYMHLGQVFNSKEGHSNLSNNISSTSQAEHQKIIDVKPEDCSPVLETLHEKLLTIIEEKEITNTSDYFLKSLSPNDSNTNTGKVVAEIINQVKIHEEQNNNFNRKVVFTNLDNIVDEQTNKSEPRKMGKSINSHCSLPTSKKSNNICNHNTTESFVRWEKFCETSEKLMTRSFSFTQLNSVTESCNGDDEYSTSCKTVDDMQLSKIPLKNYNTSYQHKRMNRSKSCESILKEVKHLPHLLYDRFLKFLSEEIEKIRKESVVCTCQKLYNKENQRKRSPKKSPVKLTNKINNIGSNVTESRLPLRSQNYEEIANKTRLSPKITNSIFLSPPTRNGITFSSRTAIPIKLSPEVVNQTQLSPGTHHQTKLSPKADNRTRFSPEVTPRNLSQFQTSPRSPIKTPTTPSKSRYFWNKQIVSPVGEYIRGKRQSPFQSSPNKKQ
ncbi:uncharacterized protein LOC131675757 [Phymastichus coffea]|uniref:uncharacterized protein LOC131675757 n=1 Tax=Phymastichus coffea TaxID=108790 RepID=UPI00273C388C|nr:uncharacterized protein LOC131675757 [Phymastichus coffea]